MHRQGSLGNDCCALYLAEAVMSDDAILLKLEEDYTCPITQACLLIVTPFLQNTVTLLGMCCSHDCLSVALQINMYAWLPDAAGK